MTSNANTTESKPVERAEGRWWETYLIRYPIPSLVGALALLVVLLALPASRHHVLDLVRAEGGHAGFDKTGILLFGGALAIGGVVLCYLASTPMLVLHAMRPFIRASRPFSLSTMVITLGLLVALGTAVMIIVGPKVISTWVGGMRGLVMGLFVLVVSCQVFLLARFILSHQSPALFAYYAKLSDRRQSGAQDDLVTSVRHLREHGNAVGIVCLELLMAATVYYMLSAESMSATEQVLAASALVGSWTLPAAVVWFVAQQLEAEFVASVQVPSAPSPGGKP